MISGVRSNELERRICANQFWWIKSIVHDETSKSVVLRLLQYMAPSNSIVREVEFFEVESFEESFDGDDDFDPAVDIDDLIGLDEYLEETSILCVIRTDQREMIFRTRAEPTVTDRDANQSE